MIKKWQKDMEKAILDATPQEALPIFCKYLYEDVFLLIINRNITIPRDKFDILNVSVYIKYVPQKECNNIDVAFQCLLPQEMRRRYIL